MCKEKLFIMAHDPSVGDVLIAIQQVTRELRAIQKEISSQIISSGATPGKNVFLESPSGMEIIMGFKAGIDELRHTLWLYIDNVRRGPDIDAARQSRLLQRATEMFRVLSQSPAPIVSHSASADCFVNYLLEVVGSYMDKPPASSQDQPATTIEMPLAESVEKS